MSRYYPTCSKCGQDNDSKSGNWCKQCYRDYHKENKDRRNAQRRAKAAANREEDRRKRRAWRKANPDKVKAAWKKDNEKRKTDPEYRARVLASKKRHHRENKERYNEQARQRYQENKEEYLIASKNRKYLIRAGAQNHPEFFTPWWWTKRKEEFDNRCIYCGEQETEDSPLTIEHMTPLSRDPNGHRPDNIAPACFSCNAAKQDKTVWEFMWYREVAQQESIHG